MTASVTYFAFAQPLGGALNVLPDAALRSIANNLASLRLDPLLHLKIAAVVVGTLMHSDARVPRANGADPNPAKAQ
jgi:hypothetical protein